MKCFRTIAGLLTLSSILAIGCAQETKQTDKKVVETPGGKTTVTTETTVDKTGDHKTTNPPANP